MPSELELKNPGWRGGMPQPHVCRITGKYNWACRCKDCIEDVLKYQRENLALDKVNHQFYNYLKDKINAVRQRIHGRTDNL